MKKQGILISILIFFISSFQIYGRRADYDSTNEEELTTILKKCAEYCERLDKSSLFFICKEKIKEIRYHPTLGDTNVFVYDYQLIRKNKKITEQRILIEENGLKRHEKDAQLKTKLFYYKNITFGPYGLLSESQQQHYDYKIVNEDKFNNEEALVIEAIPKSVEVSHDLYGKAWVRKADFSILKIEWEQKSIENFKVSESIAKFFNAEPLISLVAIYGFEKNGIRFPSEFSIIEAYINKSTLNKSVRSRTTISYDDYKFFTVETEVKH